MVLPQRGRLYRSYASAIQRRGGIPKAPRTSVWANQWRTAGSKRLLSSKSSSYRRRTLSQTGETALSYPAAQFQSKTDGGGLIGTNRLQSPAVLGITRRSTTTQGLNNREDDQIYLSGIKLSMFLQDNISESTAPYCEYVNVALVSFKGSVTSANTQLFSSPAGTARASNFDNVALTPLERHSLPINSDNFIVHFHKKIILSHWAGASVDADGGTAPKNYYIDTYCPIKRQIRFNSATGLPETEFRLLFWCGIPGEAAADPVPTTANALNYEYNVVAYFRNP